MERGVELEKQLRAGPHKASLEEGPGPECEAGQGRILSRVVWFCPSDCRLEGAGGGAPQEAVAAFQEIVRLHQEAGCSAGEKVGLCICVKVGQACDREATSAAGLVQPPLAEMRGCRGGAGTGNAGLGMEAKVCLDLLSSADLGSICGWHQATGWLCENGA